MIGSAPRAHRVQLEIAVQDAAGARTAFQAGADRVELCQALAETGGLTPSAGAVEAVLSVAGRAERVAVLVRPRPGGFVYDADEVAVVAADVREIVRRGAGAVVVGALDADGRIDVDAVSRWIDAAEGAEVVFHRAIDTLTAPADAIDQLAELGIRRILTSGGAVRSIDGLSTIEALARRSDGRVQIMPGGGVRAVDIPAFVAVGADAVHLSARRPSGDTSPSGPGGGASGFDVTDATIVAAARTALDGVTAAR
ncbi:MULTISPECIES: copper homeostasis protein CutC [unclassified Microbacterium]|uniref:copper homeostasis protein CutC n=1 Tax=unclassified Microbacterium TaxID=2609290 RepID=UPI0012F752BD|nr:copper homeostasis protein CutC [Microbacterium sp. MAH-37]MVQ42270.1 copper homeostasis protein CutC [Microbacterium sp. MAH-37]